MKRSICICLVLLTVVFVKPAPSAQPYADYMTKRFKRDEACLEEAEIDREFIDTAVATVAARSTPSEDQKYKKYLSCSYKKLGFQGPDGVIQYNRITDFLSKFYNSGDLKGIMDQCKNVKESAEDKAYETLLCVVAYIGTLTVKSDT